MSVVVMMGRMMALLLKTLHHEEINIQIDHQMGVPIEERKMRHKVISQMHLIFHSYYNRLFLISQEKHLPNGIIEKNQLDIEDLRERSENLTPIVALRNLKLPANLPMTSQRDIQRMDVWLETDNNYNSLVSVYLIFFIKTYSLFKILNV